MADPDQRQPLTLTPQEQAIFFEVLDHSVRQAVLFWMRCRGQGFRKALITEPPPQVSRPLHGALARLKPSRLALQADKALEKLARRGFLHLPARPAAVSTDLHPVESSLSAAVQGHVIAYLSRTYEVNLREEGWLRIHKAGGPSGSLEVPALRIIKPEPPAHTPAPKKVLTPEQERERRRRLRRRRRGGVERKVEPEGFRDFALIYAGGFETNRSRH